MELKEDLQTYLDKARPILRKKIEHSIDLIRKGEALALKYDKENGYFLAFSGGKDSQCLIHLAQMAGVKFKANMSLTSVDPPRVIRFVRHHYPEVVLHSPKESIYSLAVKRKILPTMRVRWCCADLKESASAGKVTLTGIRASESVRRSKRNEVEVSNKKYSGDLDGFYEWSKEQFGKKHRKINEDEFSMTSDNEVRCIGGRDSIIINPIFTWTEKDVWDFLNDVCQVPHCELYDDGFHRIGCILCPMSSPRQKQIEIKRYPHVKNNWIKAINEIRRRGGFYTDYIWWNIPANHVVPMMPTKNKMHSNKNGLFSESPVSSGEVTGRKVFSEDEIAESIFDWWISGKSYEKWFAERFLQLKLF